MSVLETGERFPPHEWKGVAIGGARVDGLSRCARCLLFTAEVAGLPDGKGRCWLPVLGCSNADGSMDIVMVDRVDETFGVAPRGGLTSERTLPWSEYPAFMGIKGPPT